ncbi:MAG: DMT family transporter [Pseudomonadota bacterium]
MASLTGYQDRPLLGIFYRAAAMACFAATFALVKHLGDEGVHLIETLFYRYLIGCVLLGGYALLTSGPSVLKTDRLGAHFYRAIIGMFAMGLNFGAVLLLPLAEAATLGFMLPLVSTILSVIILKEVVGLHRWSAIAIGFIGILIAVRPGAGGFALDGTLVGLAGTCAAAYTSILVRDLARTETTSTIVFYYMMLATPVLGLLMVVYASGHSLEIFGYIALMGLLGTLGMVAMSESLRLASVAVGAPLDYTYFIFAAAFGYFIWGDWPALSVWLGLPLIVGSGRYVAYREHQRREGAAKLQQV